MKKTLLLTSLVASMVAMAGTTGSVEAYNENEATFVKGEKPTFVAKKTGVKTEVKVEGTGFSFGGDFKAEDLELGKVTKDKFLDHSKVWAKYELPELKGVKSYVKATAEPKYIGEANKDKGSAELEGQASYKYGEFTFGLQSKTNFPFIKSADNTDNYGKGVKSTYKLFVESEEKKDVFVKGLKDVKANLEIKHDYAKTVAKAGDRVDYVSGEASAKYDAVKDLELEGKVAFKKNISGKEIEKYEVLGTELFTKKDAKYIHSYELKGTYKGVKHLTLSAKPFVAHVHIADKKDQIMYGTELVTEYKMLNDKLTLTGKSLLAGNTDKTSFVTKENTKESVVVTKGYFVFDANAKYDYSVTDKFTVSPEVNTNLSLFVHKGINGTVTEPTLTLTPKVSAEYKPTDTLTLKGSVETPVKFKVVGKEFKYTDTQVKTSLNLKYEWK
ncbi:hypothetical protein [uncultured Sneathia sp.]|uniref:hypothetical protein n=1 Tax=uncultured Sneathia sp. TaxID=278067 RepID=UPI002595E324|nr:hypothetical protein [uncultured Sneathia sp.]